MPARTVLTIGNFDGVHLGHRALIARARELADAEAGTGRVVALTFHPHPVTVLAPERAGPALTTFDRRVMALREAGADEIVRLEPTTQLLGSSPEAFIARLVEEYAPGAIVEGSDFRFGQARAGDVQTLLRLGKAMGFDVEIVEPVSVALSDQTIVTASSSIVRWLLQHGRIRDATRVLGRPYELAGNVIRGDRRGREIGFPTANLRFETLAPGDGVYAAQAALPGGRLYPAAVHVGPRATFDLPERTVEAHIMRWPGPLAEGTPEYEWPLVLLFYGWLRGQAKFESVETLVEQMGRDVGRAKEMLDRRALEHVRTFEEAGA